MARCNGPTASWLKRQAPLLWLLLAAITVRILLFYAISDNIFGFVEAGEASKVALTLARTGVFGDAYFQGQGPTAHLLPILPAIAAGILRICGFGAMGSLVLLGWSLAQVITGYLLVRNLYSRLGYNHAALRGGMSLLCLVPVFLPQEVSEFRYWEGACAVTLATLNLLLLLRFERGASLGWRWLAAIGVLSGLTFFVSPATGLAVDACWAWFAFRRRRPGRILRFAVAGAAGLALFVVPWSVRNAEVLGTFVPLRSNFGLEWAIGTDPGAPFSAIPTARYAARIARLHPYSSASARQRLHEMGGEVAYSRHLENETAKWAAAHPIALVKVSLWHLSGFYFPQLYFTGLETSRQIRASIISLVVLLGLIRLAIGAWRRERGNAALIVYLVIVALPYALVQPIPRYTYLIYVLLAFPAFDLVRIAIREIRNALSNPARDAPDRRAGAPLDGRAPRYRG